MIALMIKLVSDKREEAHLPRRRRVFQLSNEEGVSCPNEGRKKLHSFPSMIARLGVEGFIGELCDGFRLLMDVNMGLITFESLKVSTFLLGLEVRDDDLLCMLMEGDLDGDGALNQMEFCILMFRLSPCLMDMQGNNEYPVHARVINLL
ncbi:hypothetical protein V8G54_023883 [Vigna mungo]|uniref:EF-hand domain-containing protein n=1 Tax=Vigna mungo TaxID=3915 RepID=A0AAQ3RQS3_VIGMU